MNMSGPGGGEWREGLLTEFGGSGLEKTGSRCAGVTSRPATGVQLPEPEARARSPGQTGELCENRNTTTRQTRLDFSYDRLSVLTVTCPETVCVSFNQHLNV